MNIKNGVLISINKLKDIKNGKFIIPQEVTSIGDFAFNYCTSLTNLQIPDSVTRIGDGAFWKCGSLTSITIPNSVTSIGNYAFDYCSSLTSVTIPDSVTSIGSDAFGDCSLIKEDKKYYYKAFKSNLTCRGFQYEENKWFEYEGELKLCRNGFHACKNAFDLFNYYYGELNKDIVIYKVELDGVSDEKQIDSKVVAKKIRLVEKINSYAELLN